MSRICGWRPMADDKKEPYVNPVTGKVAPKRGFAAMSETKRKEIASRGGKAVRPENRFFSQDPNEASAAGAKGRKTQGKSG